MNEYPIEGLMNTAMNSIKQMVDVNTIIGDPIESSNNVVVIPVSKVNFGFVAGGSEFNQKANKEDNKENNEKRMPFGGGAGAGVSISPIAFIVIEEKGVKLLPIDHTSSIDRLLDYVPDLIDKVNNLISKKMDQINNNEIIKNVKSIDKAKSNEEKNSKNNSEKTEQVDYEYDETNNDM